MKKGFTLIELLAVIVILAIILAVAVPSIGSMVNNVKMSAYQSNEKKLEKLASTYIFLNGNSYPTTGSRIIITLNDLKDANLIENLRDVQNDEIECDAYVEVSKTLSAFKYDSYLKCGENYQTIGYDGLNVPHATVVGDGGRDYFRSVDKSQNGYIVVGNSDSNSKDLYNMNNGSMDASIASYDSDGNVEWKDNYGGKRLDYFYGVSTLSDGYVAVGNSNSIDIDLANLNKGGIDATIVKYGLNGEIAWNKNYGGMGSDYYYGVTKIVDGIIAVGSTTSKDGDLIGVTTKGGTDATIVKYDFNGNIIWKKNYGGSGTDLFYSVFSNENGIFAVGYSASTNGDLSDVTRKGGTDSIIVKFDNDGNIVWKKNFGGTGTDYFTNIDLASDGIVAVGYSNSTNLDLIDLNKGGYDSIIVKYDFNGNIVWNKNYGGTSTDHFWDVSISPNGNIVAVGRSISSDLDLVGVFKGRAGYYTAVATQYNSIGENISSKGYGGTSSDHDYFESVFADNDSYVAVGYSNATSGDVGFLNKGDYDGIAVKFDYSNVVIWKKNFGGGTGSDYFQKVAEFGDSYVSVGYSSSTSTVFLDKYKGETDAIIFRYDLSGNIIWNKNYGGTGTDYFYDVLTGEDEIIAVGSSNSVNNDLTGLNKGNYDAIIVKYDKDGNIIWKKNFGGTNSDYFYGITITSDGYVVVGRSISTDGDLIGLNKGGYDAIVVKYDKDGNVIWSKTFGGSLDDLFQNIYLTSNGYLVAVGYSPSINGDLEGLNLGGIDANIVKMNTDGEIVWKKNYGGSGSDYFRDVVTLSGIYYVVGYSASTDGNLAGLSKGGTDAIILSLTKEGEIIWNKNYGGSSTDIFYDIAIKNEQLYVVGSSLSTNGDLSTVTRKGATDATLVQFDLDGQILQKINFGGSGDDVSYGLASVRDGIILTGYTSSITHDFQDMGSGYLDAMTIGYK